MLRGRLPQFEEAFSEPSWSTLASRWQSEDREAERQRKLAERLHHYSEVGQAAKPSSHQRGGQQRQGNG